MLDSRRILVIGLLLMVLALGVIYWWFDPSEVRWMPRCLWNAVTSMDCPGCGSQRMIHALLHGDLASAWRANPFALCMLPVIGIMFWLELARGRYPRLYARVFSPVVIRTLVVLVIAWWIFRNVWI